MRTNAFRFPIVISLIPYGLQSTRCRSTLELYSFRDSIIVIRVIPLQILGSAFMLTSGNTVYLIGPFLRE